MQPKPADGTLAAVARGGWLATIKRGRGVCSMYFVGDGSEVLAAEAWRENAIEALKRLQADMPYAADLLRLYECDPCEVAWWDGVGWDWVHHAEHAAALAAGYDLPTLAEVLAEQGIDPSRPPGGE